MANSDGVEILPVDGAVERLDTEVIYKYTDWFNPEIQSRLQTAEKFEILIPNRVPRKLIEVVK